MPMILPLLLLYYSPPALRMSSASSYGCIRPVFQAAAMRI